MSTERHPAEDALNAMAFANNAKRLELEAEVEKWRSCAIAVRQCAVAMASELRRMYSHVLIQSASAEDRKAVLQNLADLEKLETAMGVR